ncbi:hypothetical protein AZI86_11030 [Bdellovibrio bacteriovorus]|uniref:Uncharacterized protein n=1 Tax=Bdellovibrio bacteriovorus TaxID=959 RepID=A0A150WLB7_BDEBC|nr:hypothetical protein [Bdellovibrio bacteriovorus]KYG64734.1 hypothetical protein AZI86_11030 [Bdellovibrio bacteriovorus]
MRGFKRSAQFALSLILVFAGVWSLSLVISYYRGSASLYEKSYTAFHNQFYKMRMMNSQDRLVTIMGISSAREAFDEDVLNAGRDGFKYTNLGTGAFDGLAPSLELFSQLFKKYGSRSDYVFVGLQSYILRPGYLSTLHSGIDDLMTFSAQGDLLSVEVEGSREQLKRKLIANDIFPLSLYTWRVGQMVRLACLKLHDFIYSDKVSSVPEDLLKFSPRSEFLYGDKSYDPVNQSLRIKELLKHLEKSDFRPDLSSTESLKRALKDLGSMSKNGKVVVLMLPEHSALRNDKRLEWLKSSLYNVLKSSSEVSEIMDISDIVPDEYFYDGGHVLSPGRKIVTDFLLENMSQRQSSQSRN